MIKNKSIINLTVSLIINSVVIFSFNSIANSESPFQVIYGNDDRYERNDYPLSKFRLFSKSVAGRIQKRKLIFDQTTNSYNFKEIPLSRVKLLGRHYCPETKFIEQSILPSCTGFLVEKDLLITAGHCIERKFDCSNYLWAFDYTEGTKSIKQEDVYECKEILITTQVDTKYKFKDYAVIRLNKIVTNRTPLKMRKKGHLRLGTPLIMIGHPYGLPLKISDGATNRFMSKDEWKKPISNWIKRLNYFTANLDAFAGNSGSPVFNQKTGLVEGILTDGDEDEVLNKKRNCWEIKKKSNKTKNVVEQIFRATKIKY